MNGLLAKIDEEDEFFEENDEKEGEGTYRWK